KKVNFVLFALTKCDAYPGWRTILADDRGQLQAHAPRFGSAPWFPVSARLAEMAMSMPLDAARELIAESRIAELQHALIELAGERVLSQVFAPHQLQHVLRQLNARLRHALGTKPRREAGGDHGMVVMSSAGMVMMGSRAASMGAGALGLGTLAGGLVIPVVGL